MSLQLDYEKYQARVDNGRKKTKRSERDNAALEKAENELVRSRDVRCTTCTGDAKRWNYVTKTAYDPWSLLIPYHP